MPTVSQRPKRVTRVVDSVVVDKLTALPHSITFELDNWICWLTAQEFPSVRGLPLWRVAAAKKPQVEKTLRWCSSLFLSLGDVDVRINAEVDTEALRFHRHWVFWTQLMLFHGSVPKNSNQPKRTFQMGAFQNGLRDELSAIQLIWGWETSQSKQRRGSYKNRMCLLERSAKYSPSLTSWC